MNLDNHGAIIERAVVVDLTKELTSVATADANFNFRSSEPTQLGILRVVKAHPLFVTGIGVSHKSRTVIVLVAEFTRVSKVEVMADFMHLARGKCAPLSTVN